jgi:hypothetical protein
VRSPFHPDRTLDNSIRLTHLAMDTNNLSDAQLWSLKYLHAPSSTRSVGIPDDDVSARCVFELRDETTIPAPSGTTNYWDVLFLAQPNVEDDFVWWSAHDGNAPVLANGVDDSIASMNWGTFAQGSAQHRVCYGSHTYRLIANDLSNQGWVVSANQRLSATEYTITAGADPTQNYLLNTGFANAFSSGGTLKQLSNKAYTNHARHGLFVPLRHIGPVVPYVDSHPIPTTFVFTDGNYTLGPKSRPCNFAANWTLFTGLSPNASLQITTHRGIEFQPTARGTYAPFISNATSPSPEVLRAAYAKAAAEPDAYPESANDFGDIMRAIGSFAMREGPRFLGSAIPVVGPVAGPLLSGLSQALSAASCFQPNNQDAGATKRRGRKVKPSRQRRK